MIDKSLYGRKWELSVVCDDGTMLTLGKNGIDGPESLKCTFEINYPGYEGWYFSEFNIWNPTPDTERKIIREGAEVHFSAGYSEGRYGKIFGGKVFQSLFTRENVTDYKLTLLCMDGARLFKDNFVSLIMAKEYREQTLLNEIAARAISPIEVGHITEGINVCEKPRGAVFFGSPMTPVREIARSNAAQIFMVNDQLQMARLEDLPQGAFFDIKPSTGLIGTPEQTDFGINFRTLLNPDLILTNPPRWVKLDLSGINVKQKKAVIGQARIPLLPNDGYFKVGGIRHSGDTRGNEWYTDVIGYSLTGKAPLQLFMTPEMLQNPKYDPT